jgi:hypothetical protein
VVEVAGADPALVTLEIRPLEELFTDLVIDEQIDSDPENLEVPADVLEAYDVEPGEDGAYVFVPREDVQGELQPGRARLPRGGVQGTVASSVGPFSCGSDITFPLGLNSPPTFSVVPNVSVDFQYSSGSGLERLVATGGATLTASYKPRLQAAVQGKITCRARLLGMTISVPGPIALIVGGYVPIGIGFEASGTVTVAQVGFDATFQDSFSVQVGVDCSTGSCEAVAGAPEPAAPSSPPPPPFRWVLPNVLTDFNVALGLSAYGYFELRIGNPLWETLQLKMVEGQAGVTQTANLAPKLTQIENTTSASSYKLSLYAKVGSGVSLNNILEFLNINVAAFEVKAELDVANSPSAATTPDGSLTFAGPVAVGQQVEATVVLKDVTYLGLQNVEEVRFYRKDSLVLLERAAVSRTQDGQTEYVARWTATASDLGEEFGVFVKTFVPIIEFEIEPNSLRTLEERELGWSAAVTFPPQIAEETNEALVVVVTNESGSPVAGAAVALSATGGTVGTSSGTTDSDGRFETTARLSAGEPALTIVIEVRETPGGELRASETVVATRSAFALDSFFWNTQNGCTTEGRCTTVFANTPTELSVTTTYADEYPNPACIGLTASAHAVVQTGPDGVVTIAGELRADETADCLDLHSQALIRFSVESSSFAYTLDVDLSQNPRAGGVALSRFHLQSFGVGISPVVCVPMGLNPTLCPDPPATTGVLEPGPYTIFARTLSESIPFTLTLTP